LFLFVLPLNALEISDSLRVDSYLNLSTLSSSNENEQNEQNGIDTSGGVQARYQLNDTISTTGQVYIHEEVNNRANDTFDVDVKWLYMDYYVGFDITLRAGKFQFPIFKSSETGTIGYSYTWTETPLAHYGANGYEDFIGGEVLQKYFYDDFEFLIQLSYGASENDLPTNKDDTTIKGKTDSLAGITLKTNHDLFNVNLGYLQATSKLDNVDSDKVYFHMLALEGEIYIEAATVKAGYIYVKLSDIFPDEHQYYLSLEYSYKNFTPYIYYSTENLYFKENSSLVSNKLTLDYATNEKYSSGVRYDFYENMALKLSYTKSQNYLNFSSDSSTIQEAYTYKAVLNVIF
jgi:hypothetical protein